MGYSTEYTCTQGRRRHTLRYRTGLYSGRGVAYDDLMAAGSYHAAQKAGKVRLEGKEYIVKDGDVINFRFSV